jgi:hypothetical protein
LLQLQPFAGGEPQEKKRKRKKALPNLTKEVGEALKIHGNKLAGYRRIP